MATPQAMHPDRYQRQRLLRQLGSSGQEALARASVLLIGCGALGTVIADQLARAGVGHLRIVDRDLVEWTNLQRQVLFDENDAAQSLPKAIAAAQRLAAINSSIDIEPLVMDVNASNIQDLLAAHRPKHVHEPGTVDLILDGTDNAATRYLVNDLATKHAIPWIYGACVGTEGRAMAILPGQGPCLRCIFPDPPEAGELPTCDTVGVLGPAAAVVGSLQVTAALQILSGHRDAVAARLWALDLWDARIHPMDVRAARRPDCVCCGQRRFEFLDAPVGRTPVSLCGRDAVQVLPAGRSGRIDMDRLAQQLSAVGVVQRTPYLLRCTLHAPETLGLTLFPDGRLIVHGTTDLGRARSAYAKYIGA